MSDAMYVTLSWPELRRAGHVGIDRYVRALADHRTPMNGGKHNDWQNHVIGAWGECVIAKTIGRYWPLDHDQPDRGAPDVGTLHVRTRTKPGDDLAIMRGDADNEPFVLVVFDRLPRFRVVGWCLGGEGKRPEYWNDTKGKLMYFVPQSVLRPFADVLEAVG